MKHNWEYKRLGDVCKEKKEVRRASSTYNAEDHIEYIDISSIDRNINQITNTTAYCFKEAPSRAQQCIEKEDVLVSLVRPNLKNIAIVNDCRNNLVASSGFCVLRGRNLLQKILFYVVNSRKFTDTLIAKCAGAAYPAVKEDDIRGIVIPVPPMEVQEQIVAELDQINDLIAKNRELLSQLDALAQSLFYDTFGDPITNTKGWIASRIEDCCSHLYAGGDKPKDTTTERTAENQIPIYSNGVDNKGLYGYTSVPRSTAPSITISGRGTIGVPFIRKTPFFPIIRLIVATPDPSIIDIQYLYFIFLSLNLGGKGAAIPQLTVPMVKDINIPIPPLSLQEEFAAKVEAIEAQKAKVEAEIAELQTLLDARMDYWFN